jgi:ssDNA-binding Zn-finger/Zn-ribbon topoisomerase 1
MTATILPCPFCGSAGVLKYGWGDGVLVVCSGSEACPARLGSGVYHYVDEEEDEEEDEGVQNAIAEWNRRVTPPEGTRTTSPNP